MILFFNYSIVVPNYFFPIDSNFIIEDTLSYAKTSLNILYVFNYAIFYTLPRNIRSLEEQNFWYTKIKWNKSTRIFAIICLIYILIFEFKLPTFAGERGGGTPIYEYSVIIMVFSLSFTSDVKGRKWFIFISLLYILQENVFGARLIALQYIICVYILVFSQKYKLKTIFPYIVIMFLFYNIIGAVRGAIMYGGYDAENILSSLSGNYFTQDTAYSAYFTSETTTHLSETISGQERWDLFVDFLKMIFVGEGGYLHGRVLATYTQNYYMNWGGGVIPHHFFFFLGSCGLVIPILILRLYFSFINCRDYKNKSLIKHIGFYVTVSCPRWYLYSPLILIRAIMFLIIAYYIFMFFNRFSTKRI